VPKRTRIESDVDVATFEKWHVHAHVRKSLTERSARHEFQQILFGHTFSDLFPMFLLYTTIYMYMFPEFRSSFPVPHLNGRSQSLPILSDFRLAAITIPSRILNDWTAVATTGPRYTNMFYCVSAYKRTELMQSDEYPEQSRTFKHEQILSREFRNTEGAHASA